jgi:hypothetical protein
LRSASAKKGWRRRQPPAGNARTVNRQSWSRNLPTVGFFFSLLLLLFPLLLPDDFRSLETELMQILNRISIHEKLTVCSISSFFLFVHADNLRTENNNKALLLLLLLLLLTPLFVSRSALLQNVS